MMTPRIEHFIDFARKALLTAAGSFAVAEPLLFGLMSAPQLHAQTTAAEHSPKPKFEVASIKPDESGRGNVMLGVTPGGRFNADNVTLRLLVEIAYNVKSSQLTGGSKWIDSAHYDIEAKPPDSFARSLSKLSRDESQQQLRLMVQSLLADRFKLTLSHTKKELPIYALVVAKHGPKLHPGNSEPSGTSRMRRGIRIGRGGLDVKDAPLTMLADALSRTLGRIVVDKTGLKGNYDFTLKWTPDESQGRMFEGPPEKGNQSMGGPPQRMGGPAPAPPPETSGPSIFTALQEQLGL
ncbi:MAG: TIGR03435 family protein, partial [Terriglobia bacterium]